MFARPTRLWDRLYEDFLVPSRLPAYRQLLETGLDSGREIVSVERFWDMLRAGAVDPSGRYLILRHDIDVSVGTARAMWQIGQELGVCGSFYFRLSTLDVGLMQTIHDSGGEASYHYEEIATLAKRRRLKSKAAIFAVLDDARAMFRVNLERLRAATGLPMRVVASHGDFANRALGIANHALLADPAFRREVRVELETYDECFMRHVTSRHADACPPGSWIPNDPREALTRAGPVVYILVHPRHWHADRLANVVDDVRRLAEGATYLLPARSARAGR